MPSDRRGCGRATFQIANNLVILSAAKDLLYAMPAQKLTLGAPSLPQPHRGKGGTGTESANLLTRQSAKRANPLQEVSCPDAH
jgi:hypothetical protein